MYFSLDKATSKNSKVRSSNFEAFAMRSRKCECTHSVKNNGSEGRNISREDVQSKVTTAALHRRTSCEGGVAVVIQAWNAPLRSSSGK